MSLIFFSKIILINEEKDQQPTCSCYGEDRVKSESRLKYPHSAATSHCTTLI